MPSERERELERKREREGGGGGREREREVTPSLSAEIGDECTLSFAKIRTLHCARKKLNWAIN